MIPASPRGKKPPKVRRITLRTSVGTTSMTEDVWILLSPHLLRRNRRRRALLYADASVWERVLGGGGVEGMDDRSEHLQALEHVRVRERLALPVRSQARDRARGVSQREPVQLQPELGRHKVDDRCQERVRGVAACLARVGLVR